MKYSDTFHPHPGDIVLMPWIGERFKKAKITDIIDDKYVVVKANTGEYREKISDLVFIREKFNLPE